MLRMSKAARRVLVAVICALLACRRTAPVYLDMATTTSVDNSGLLNALLPHFQSATVRVHPVGSGLALKMLSDGDVEVVISHAPETESRYLGQHPDWSYRKIAFNQFLVVGPAVDPAHIRDAKNAIDAFRRIAASDATFVSRGDQSGTHEREQSLWKAAAVTPSADRLLVSGAGMAITLRQTNERQSYTLADDSTFWQLQSRLNLAVLFDSDPRLLNTYAVVFPSNKSSAAGFADWLASGDGRRRIADYRIQGRTAFNVWPLGCPFSMPDAQPCGASISRQR
jgi:tungstate transport system substrate-binding protein